MRDETRGAIVIAVLVTLYAGAVTLLRANRQPLGASVTQALGREATDILRADAIALVSETDEAIEVWPRGSTHSASLRDQAALAAWLCSAEAPRDTAVVLLRGLPLSRGRLDQASKEGRLAIEEIRGAPLRLECAARVKFYSMSMKGTEPEGQ